MAIPFSDVGQPLTPGQFVEFDDSRALQGAPAQPHKILAIGTRLSAGTVAEQVLTLVPSGDLAEDYFGRGSMLAEMCKAAKDQREAIELWAIALDEDAGGTASEWTLTFSGTATADGTLYLYIAGKRIEVAVASGDAAASVASAVDTELGLSKHGDLPFSSGVSMAVVTLTAKHKGTCGDRIDIRFNYGDREFFPAGISCVIANSVNGATDPDPDDALDDIGGSWFRTILSGYNTTGDLTKLDTHLETQWGPLIQKEGMAFVSYHDTLANSQSAADADDTKHVSMACPGKVLEPEYVFAARYGTEEAWATINHPVRPRTGRVIKKITPPAPGDQFTRSQRNTLINVGGATFIHNAGRVSIDRPVTLYETNSSGTPDDTYQDTYVHRVLGYLRYDWRIRIALKYSNSLLADDDGEFGAGLDVVTPALLKSEATAWFEEKREAGWVEGSTDEFVSLLISERHASDVNRADILLPPDLMNQFLVHAASIQFRL